MADGGLDVLTLWTPPRKSGGIPRRLSTRFSLGMHNEQADAGWDGRTRRARPNSYKFSGVNVDRETSIFPVQLTTSRIGYLTRLIHTLLYVMTIHTHIHTLSPPPPFEYKRVALGVFLGWRRKFLKILSFFSLLNRIIYLLCESTTNIRQYIIHISAVLSLYYIKKILILSSIRLDTFPRITHFRQRSCIV